MRRVLRDYSDTKCIEILKHLAAAAAPDSVILISEMMIPATTGEGDLPIVCMDMSMLNMGGKERSDKQFAEILTAAGLELTKVWEGFGADRLLEARLSSQVDGGWVGRASGHNPDASDVDSSSAAKRVEWQKSSVLE